MSINYTTVEETQEQINLLTNNFQGYTNQDYRDYTRLLSALIEHKWYLIRQARLHTKVIQVEEHAHIYTLGEPCTCTETHYTHPVR